MDRAHRNLMSVTINAEGALPRLFALCGRGEEVLPEMRDNLLLTLHHLLSLGPKEEGRKELVTRIPGALEVLLRSMDDPKLALPARAAAAGCVRLWMSPDLVLAKEEAVARRAVQEEEARVGHMYPDVYSSLRPATSYGVNRPSTSSSTSASRPRSPTRSLGRPGTSPAHAAFAVATARGRQDNHQEAFGVGFGESVGISFIGLPPKQAPDVSGMPLRPPGVWRTRQRTAPIAPCRA